MESPTLSFEPQARGQYKTATAFVRIDPGEGSFVINGESAPTYFEENPHWRKALAPFEAVNADHASYGIRACVAGRAKRWSKRQPRALAHAIAGALTAAVPSRHDRLWRAGFRFHVLSDRDRIEDLPPEDWLLLRPDELWARYHTLFFDSIPRQWAHNPHVVTCHGRWLLDVLLLPMDQDDLVAVREYLEEQGQAVSDVTILEHVFRVTPQHDDFYRWRFSLSYRLEAEEDFGFEFVGSGDTWLWALEGAPVQRPERHHRLPGTEGLEVQYVEMEHVHAALDDDEAPVEENRQEDPHDWQPTAQTWEHVLTYYDWHHGILPYSRHARQIIPPLLDGQRRAVLRFRAPQVTDDPFLVTLRAHPRGPWLHAKALKELFVGYLVPGARIWIDRTEQPALYVIRYRQTQPRHRRLLFFKDGRVRPVIEDRQVSCEVDETMLLAEGRYSNIEALDRLDLVDRRTAPKVLARVFELVGAKDKSRGVYCAHFDEVFPVLCVAKPYARSYINNILYNRKIYPWFYTDDQQGPGWFVYDPEKTRKVVTRSHQGSTRAPTVEVVQLTSARDLWDELDDRTRRLLQQAADDYKADPTRENVLFLRELAHQRIRTLLSEERLPALSLDAFNREIWRLGSFEYQGQEYQLGSEEADDLFTHVSLDSMKAAYDSGRLSIEGNQTWGSGSHEFGPRLNKTDPEKERIIRDGLRSLLYADGPIQRRMEQIITSSNGFGINTVSGILHAMHPYDHILYNRRSVEALETIGVRWAANWRHDVHTYLIYRDFCHHLKEALGFRSLTEVDWFVYTIATGALETRHPDHVQIDEVEAFLMGLILGKGQIDRSAREVKIQLRYGHYKNGRVSGGGVGFDEQEALPRGAKQVAARLKALVPTDDSLDRVSLRQSSLYRYNIILHFTDPSGLFDRILSWYPSGSSPHTYQFPITQLQEAAHELAAAFMQGYAAATGLITDSTRERGVGKHRVYIRASAPNPEILEDVRWLLEDKLNVPVAHIHWHTGRDPQLRVYAEHFLDIGFGFEWEDRILEACAQENLRSTRRSRDQITLFEED